MTKKLLLGFATLLILAGASVLGASGGRPTVFVASIRGTINPGSSSYLKSAIRDAERAGADALIVELDTPGGLVSSVREMAQAVDESTVPVVVYVSPAGAAATSAGALLMLASHVAAMAPGTNIGAAHPVGSGGEDIKGDMGKKAVSDTAAFARGLAEVRGRNRDVAEAVVAHSKSYTADEAIREQFIEIVTPSIDGLLSALNGRRVQTRAGERTLKLLDADIHKVGMRFGQSLMHYLANPNIAALLMTLGILLIYVEISNPGLIVPGIAGAIVLLVAFMALQMLPIRVGGIALVVLGVLLMAAEPFIVSHGVLAAGGILSFLLGLIWMIDPSASSIQISTWVWIGCGLTLGSLVALIAIAAARMRKLSRETLARIGGAGVVAGVGGYSGIVDTVGTDGLSGKALFRGELWDFESDEPLKPGDSVSAETVQGIRLHIRKASKTVGN